MSRRTEAILADEFVCSHCKNVGAHVEKLAMSGTGLSRLLEIQPHRYAFVSCKNCGFTEVFNLKILEGHDNLGTFIDILFAN
jgi:predicted nucleic-acid-binding Zn-ribbon protein